MLDRRQFLAATAVALGTAQLACNNMLDLGATVGSGPYRVALPAIGSTVVIPGIGLGGQGIAVSRLNATAVVAVSLQCTHQGCTLFVPGGPSGFLQCPCHGSVFTTSGTTVSGPAGGPLQTYPVSIDSAANQAVVTL
ncbi:MAG: ubiquinol-cytochrome c reductase iron-sulfur subunit [Gemmatimonadales bacterium]